MAKANPGTARIKIYGKEQTGETLENILNNEYFALEASYAISSSRAEGDENIISLTNKDYVQLIFEDATSWFGNADTLAELFPEISFKTRSAKGVVELPMHVQADDASRSIASQVALKIFKKFSKKAVGSGMIKIAEALQKKSLEGRSGLYIIDENFELQLFRHQNPAKPALLFIHGTASSTKGSFSGLTEGTVWQEIQKIYGQNILAFEHETLTKSPLQNVLELLNKLPANTTLDMISHSRGGLVGDLLVRFSENKEGFLDASTDLLKEEGREADIKDIDAIQKLLSEKNIAIGRFVRVACPARGTSLLGKRVDIFLNVLINLINVSAPSLLPVVAGLQALISEALETRNDPEVLPGLEAMNPESVFIKILNTVSIYNNELPEGFNNKLLVISGNSKFSLSLNGLKVLLTRFFFKWEQNDLVVDTASMYLGARRKSPVQYFPDDGNNVNHFNYFVNKKTQDALLLALTATTDRVATFKEMDVENYAALDRGIFGLDGGKLAITKASGKKPVVLLLPGIMGSFLEQDNKPLWINYLSFAFGGLTKLKIENTNIKSTGLIKTAYKDLVDYLSAAYDVEVFPFDWRKPIAASGTDLNQRITELQSLKQPVHLLGHSMGGLVIRDMAINYPQTWEWLNAQGTFRTILLGTPWMGSYRIPHVLSGKDAIIKQLDTIDFAHSRSKLINMFAKFPGLLGLLPIKMNDTDFSSKKEWEVFAKASGLQWDIPGSELLQQFANFKKNVNDSLDQLDHRNIIYVAGKDEETVNGYSVENGQLVFKTTPEGDQSVTWESGIPQKINRETSLYYTNATHGGLSAKKYLFQGIKELLDTGSTTSSEFSRKPLPLTSPVSSRNITKEQYNFEISERSIETNLLGLGLDTITEESNLPILKVSVSKGDMIYATYPVLMGHFANDGIYGAEIVANKYLNNMLSLKHSLGIYPGNIGSHNFFQGNESIFKGCIISGLGQAELLNAYQLSKTIESAVADYLLTCCRMKIENNNSKSKIGLSTLIVGAGYGGMAIESSTRAIMQGVINANEKVQRLTSLENLYVDELEFIELFEDKAITCFYSLASFINGNSDGMNIAWKDKKIKSLPGARKRLLVDNNVTWWQRLSVIANHEPAKTNKTDKVLSYFSSTNNAREEKKELHHNLPLIEALLDDISIKKNWSFEKAKAIFELLIPGDFKENIRRNAPILWVLDKFTASFPWELLQTGTATEKPLCVTAGMIRQLATGEYKTSTPVKNNNVLIIGDPDLNGFTRANQLPGAEKEARTVFTKLKEAKELNIEGPVIKGSSDEILTSLFKQDYKILHLAGHGFFDENNPSMCGMLIGKIKDTDDPIFLTPHHINQLPSTPEFVFINCCFLGRINPYAEEYSANRFKLAANLGTQLIENGVKGVIVAGWEVDDSAALAFAETFYDRMLSGYNFGDAVLEARKFIYNKFGYTNTWGAFQCYGQQHYTFELHKGGSRQAKTYDISQEAENDLDNLLSKTEVSFYDADDLLKELRTISKAIDKAKFNSPDLRQKEAQAYMELNDYDKSGELYNALFKTEDASFDVKALENYQNIIVNKEIARYLSLTEPGEKDITGITDIIDISIRNLNNLLDVWKTGQRYALIASAYKRKGFVLTSDTKEQEREKLKAMEAAAMHYYAAYQKLDSSYSFANWTIMEMFLLKKKKQKWGQQVLRNGNKYKLMTLSQIEKKLSEFEKKATRSDRDLDYWELSEVIDVKHSHFFLKPTDKNFEEVTGAFQDLWKKAGSKNKQQKQIVNLKIQAHFAGFAGMPGIKKKLENFVAGIKK
ncbi:MAG: CHAT domain-containing protein [Niabella sp.]